MKAEQEPDGQFGPDRRQFGPDPRECPYELPPVERRPFADDAEKARAIRRMIEQARRERSAGGALPP